MATEEHKSTPEEEIRYIEIRILDDEDKDVFEATGTVSRRTAHKFLEGLGYIFIPEEPIRYPMPGQPSPVGKISCEYSRDCTDYPSKCSACASNKAKSYFKLKV